MSSDGKGAGHQRRQSSVQAFTQRRTNGELHDDDDGKHGPHGGAAEAVEERRDVVDHGDERESQPDLERVRHPPGVVPRDLGHLLCCGPDGQERDQPPGEAAAGVVLIFSTTAIIGIRIVAALRRRSFHGQLASSREELLMKRSMMGT